MKTDPDIQKLMEGATQTDTQDGGRLSVLHENRVSGLQKIGIDGV
jgi:hypothetical protein